MQVTINRPQKHNAFTPRTVHEMLVCFADARSDPSTGVVVLTGAGTQAFCSGGDQSVRGSGGYVGEDGVPRLNVLDLQQAIRRLPKPVICMVAGYAVGGGHILHMMCDLTVRFWGCVWRLQHRCLAANILFVCHCDLLPEKLPALDLYRKEEHRAACTHSLRHAVIDIIRSRVLQRRRTCRSQRIMASLGRQAQRWVPLMLATAAHKWCG